MDIFQNEKEMKNMKKIKNKSKMIHQMIIKTTIMKTAKMKIMRNSGYLDSDYNIDEFNINEQLQISTQMKKVQNKLIKKILTILILITKSLQLNMMKLLKQKI